MEYLNAIETGKRIKELRKEQGLKVREVSEYLGLESEQAVYKWQKGLSLPTVDNLYALSSLLNVSVDEILMGTKNKQNKEKERGEAEGPSLPYYMGVKLLFN